ncbi:MAG TPA: tetratricopeptide repeat protein [candidate division Zixibacteria bacterium]|nr:tetratricopeptide repeat protein [candidate division Zixibacteria bacterium]
MNIRQALYFLSMAFLLVITAGAFPAPEEYHRSGESHASLAPRADSNKDNPEWQFDLGWAYYEAGRYDDALRHLHRSRELKPNMAFINAKLGDVFLAMGERDSAAHYYEAALNIHYEYIEVWEKLVELAPAYHANLGLLYADKAEQTDDMIMARKARPHLDRYLSMFPQGEFADRCKAANARLALLERQAASRESLHSDIRTQQAEEARRRAELRQEMEAFRTTKPFVAGIGFYTVSLSEDKEFVATFPDSVIDDTLSMKYYAATLNEIGVNLGYVHKTIFLRGSIRFGSNRSARNYFLKDPIPYTYEYDTTWVGDSMVVVVVDSALSTKDDVRPTVNSVDTWRISAAIDYNFLFHDPVLLFIGAQAGYAQATLNDSPYNNFEKITMVGAGVGGGIMLRFSDFLFEFAYRRDITGSSAGGTIVLGALYKFNAPF